MCARTLSLSQCVYALSWWLHWIPRSACRPDEESSVDVERLKVRVKKAGNHARVSLQLKPSILHVYNYMFGYVGAGVFRGPGGWFAVVIRSSSNYFEEGNIYDMPLANNYSMFHRWCLQALHNLFFSLFSYSKYFFWLCSFLKIIKALPSLDIMHLRKWPLQYSFYLNHIVALHKAEYSGDDSCYEVKLLVSAEKLP